MRFSSGLGSVQSDDVSSLRSLDSAFCESLNSLDDVFTPARPEVYCELDHGEANPRPETERIWDLSIVPPAPKLQPDKPLYVNLQCHRTPVRLLEPHQALPASVIYTDIRSQTPSSGVGHVKLNDLDWRTESMAEILAADGEITEASATPTAEQKDRLSLRRRRAEAALLAGQASLTQLRAYAAYLRGRKPQSPEERYTRNSQLLSINKLIVVRDAFPPGLFRWPDVRDGQFFSWAQLLGMPADCEPKYQKRMLKALIKALVSHLPSDDEGDRELTTAKIALLKEKLAAVRVVQENLCIAEKTFAGSTC
ncbi:MAG: hypothetical protein KVP17_000920 [Porospora cf. gigantea B]|uniref:uncharacterized protein n=1 Tax=Porospora cf. gigantea B TaxID=2853592 RepID=UPI003571EB18|nr:MAG: hypothetical protein KVP17_000920 [Porospora cf. gigantea B]